MGSQRFNKPELDHTKCHERKLGLEECGHQVHFRVPPSDKPAPDTLGHSIHSTARRTAELHRQHLAANVRRNDDFLDRSGIKDALHFRCKSELV